MTLVMVLKSATEQPPQDERKTKHQQDLKQKAHHLIHPF